MLLLVVVEAHLHQVVAKQLGNSTKAVVEITEQYAMLLAAIQFIVNAKKLIVANGNI